MKQIWPNYSYSPTTNVLTLTGLNIDRDQLLLVSAPERGRIMYNFADSTVTASAFTAGANTGLTLVASTAGLTTTASLVIYYDDQVSGISGTVTVGVLPALTTNTDFVSVGENVAAGMNAYGTIEVNADWQNAAQGLYGLSVQATCVTSTNRIGVVTASLSAGTAQIGSVTASLAISSTAITSGSFASLTSATLVPGNVARKMATVYNLGPGQLFVNAGSTATTLGGGFMVALSSSDYLECDFTTTTLSALYATAGTASWVSH
jgi:hypothetical protein